jgi:integrative and conjugative element protein (TIGR02256 family)
MQDEATARFPYETGGILFGYWIRRPREAVVSEVIGPGPNADHGCTSFKPDAPYQEKALARLYQEYGRRHAYLGDWHTHPTGGAYLSVLDCDTLRRIALHSPARAPTPIMIVMTPSSRWRPRAWVRRRWSFLERVERYPELEVVTYLGRPWNHSERLT